MDEYIYSLDKITKVHSQLTKTSDYNDLPLAAKSSINLILKIVKTVQTKLDQHYDLYYQIVSKTQEQNIAIEKQMMKLNRNTHYQQESINNLRDQMIDQNGLDKIMIHQVKELAEAVVQSKLRIFQDQMLKRCDYDIELGMIQQQIDSLKYKIDELSSNKNVNNGLDDKIKEHQLRIFQNISKNVSAIGFEQINQKQNSNLARVQSQIQIIKHSMRNNLGQQGIKSRQQVRMVVQKKLDKKEHLEFKSKITKELANKMNAQEIEVLINNFQNKIFERMKEIVQKYQSKEETIKKTIKAQVHKFIQKKNQFKENIEKSTNKETQKIYKKLQLKMTQFNQKIQTCLKFQTNWDQLQQRMSQFEQKVEQQFSQLANLVSSELSDPTLMKNQTFNMSSVHRLPSSIKLTSSAIDTKCRLVPWQQQQYNINRENYLWQHMKTNLYIVCPGIYYAKIAVGSMKRIQAELMINGETLLPLIKTPKQWNYKQGQTLYYVGILTISQKSKVSIKVSEDARVDSALILTKMI